MALVRDIISSCVSTTNASGLSRQILSEINQVVSNSLVDFSDLNIDIAANQLTFLQPSAKVALKRAIASRGRRIKINSAYRTCVQQYILRSRFERRICGIGAAAQPGRSNHESGLALDVADFNGWKPYLVAEGWSWFGAVNPRDPWHFDFPGNPIGSTGIKAFQALWNKNNLNDRIADDGIYGTDTAKRLSLSPTTGFNLGSGQGSTLRTLRLSTPYMQGGDVRRVQVVLKNLGYLLNANDVDGIYGPTTEAAVRKFQTDQGITIDGIVGQATYGKLGID